MKKQHWMVVNLSWVEHVMIIQHLGNFMTLLVLEYWLDDRKVKRKVIFATPPPPKKEKQNKTKTKTTKKTTTTTKKALITLFTNRLWYSPTLAEMKIFQIIIANKYCIWLTNVQYYTQPLEGSSVTCSLSSCLQILFRIKLNSVALWFITSGLHSG